MSLPERRVGSVVILVAGREPQALFSPALSARIAALLAEGMRGFVVDLSEVTLLPSTEAGSLLAAAQQARRGGGRLVLAGARRTVRGTLATMGVGGIVAHLDTVDGAVREVTARSG